MSRIFPIICGLFLLVNSCKTIGVQQGMHYATTQTVALGYIGLDQNMLIDRIYKSTAIPNYSQPIKLTFTIETFSKKSFKAFKEAKAVQNQAIDIHYVDSLKTKPKFVSFKIADRVVLIKELNSKENEEVKNHLEINPSAGIITVISMGLNVEGLDAISKADAIFLISDGLKSYGLQLYSQGKPTQVIDFNQGVVFGYTVSHCCWQEDKWHQLDIVDLVENSRGCPANTYRKANRAKTKEDYFKF